MGYATITRRGKITRPRDSNLSGNEDTRFASIIKAQRDRRHVLRDLPLGVSICLLVHWLCWIGQLAPSLAGAQPTSTISYRRTAWRSFKIMHSQVTQFWLSAPGSPHFAHCAGKCCPYWVRFRHPAISSTPVKHGLIHVTIRTRSGSASTISNMFN